MRDRERTGILVVGHGSRRQEANDDLRDVARNIAERGGFELVEPAFLEIEQPDVAEGFKRLVDRGALQITVHPYFLSPGRHTRGDLPRQVGDVAASFPGVRYEITEPLSAHPLVIEASIGRIRETQVRGALPSSPACVEPINDMGRSEFGSSLGVHSTHVSRWSRAGEDACGPGSNGIVYLVGAGPGAPDLLTIRARDLLTTCDVLIHDYLVDPDILRLTPSHAQRIYAGKIGGGKCTPQTEINRLLIEYARKGKRVVRLKGGDPFLFGRGGEEAEALEQAGIRFEIVPGVSSVLGVPAYAGIPLTHRNVSSSVAIITGAHAINGSPDFTQLASVSSAHTIVILMGVTHLKAISDHLVRCGRASRTPVAVIRWGTYEAQQTVVGTLASIADDIEAVGLRSPAVIVVGEVVRLRERLRWFEKEAQNTAALEKTFGDLVVA
jgi:uroporphyrin-III C-methyltransferase